MHNSLLMHFFFSFFLFCSFITFPGHCILSFFSWMGQSNSQAFRYKAYYPVWLFLHESWQLWKNGGVKPLTIQGGTSIVIKKQQGLFMYTWGIISDPSNARQNLLLFKIKLQCHLGIFSIILSCPKTK